MKPTDAELEILNVLWQHGPATVRQVHDALAQTRDTGYTTTLKFMQIMQEKGLLTRTEAGRVHTYAAAVTETDTRQTLLDRFVETAFAGSAQSLMVQLLGSRSASQAELSEIRDLLDQLDAPDQSSPAHS
jgi:BlaI family transcriptional regulator, penicillinase repressor